MEDQIPSKRINLAWKFLIPLFGIWFLLYGSFSLSRPPLPDGVATIHAEMAREMVNRSDWTTPFVNGVPVRSSSRALDWSIAASYRIFGVADWSARLPIALCILALAIILFYFGRKLLGWNAAGFYAALFFLTIPTTFLTTRDLTSAPFLCLGTTLVAVVLWELLVVKRIQGWNAIAISATACALILLTGGWPGVLLPLAIVLLCWIVRGTTDLARQAEWFLAGWAICAYLFAGIFERRPDAIIWLAPIPPLALLLGGWLTRNEAFSDQAIGRRIAWFVFAIGLLVSLSAAFFAIHGPLLFSVHHRSVVINAPSSRVPLLITAIAFLAGVTGHLIYRLRGRIRIANCFLAGTLAGIIVAIQVGMVLASPRYSSQILADAIRPELNPNDLVVIDGKYPDASSLAFYLERPVLIALPDRVGFNLIAPAVSTGAVALSQVWTGSARVFLWTSIDHPLATPGPGFVVANSGGKQIVSNQPNSAGAAF
ncbi:Polymyxin resistance protein ArnT [Acidisarcina polymorpha]|uniref:Polymyxin resistance protein ArnT n=1 Tax=Acidisarcina polymorpha TaxID=2211140 RepID=A0A2Z5G5Q2_9BACT|nr:glycosyltransferase family 39 protein [Acidisarcina polymorpha]AXC14279.1 Polymyxin resistance protein ArnT [Acidisarcina polymorpha]